MTEPHESLLRERVREAVADRRAVDWAAILAESGGDDPELAGLRDVEAIAQAFAQARDEPRAASSGLPTPAPLFEWGHLAVLEKLGEGSFGEVYRAWDPVLERQVALKLRRLGPSQEAQSGRRYLEEARRLARVRHPNVLLVLGAAAHDGRVGLWTELIEGATLEERLAREGPLSAPEALHVGLDLATALAAIHGAGLLHGDVKAANVMRERGGRIVLMDLGAARELAQGAFGPREGTPLALAPELLAGQAPSQAGEVYSLGALLFRLLTGRHVVSASSLDELLASHARGDRLRLQDLRPDLPAGLVVALDRALAGDSEQRFATAGAFAGALATLLATAPRTLPGSGEKATEGDGDRQVAAPVGRRWAGRRRVLVGLGLGVLVAVAVLLGGRRWATSARSGPATPELPATPAADPGPGSRPVARPAVGVAMLRHLGPTDDTAWLAAGLTELLAAGLSAAGDLRVPAGEVVARAQAELGVAASMQPPPADVARLGGHLGVDSVIFGAVMVLPGAPHRLQLTVRLLDVVSGDARATVSHTAAESALPELAAAAVADLRAALGTTPGASIGTGVARLWPADPKARRRYAEGLARLRALDPRGAVAPLSEATARAPDVAGPWHALSRAHQLLGERQLALDPARRAFGLAPLLPERDRWRIEADYYRLMQDWEAALNAFGAAAAAAPDDADLEQERIQVLIMAARQADALVAIAALRQRLPQTASDPELELLAARAFQGTGQTAQMLASARRAAELAEAQGADLQLAWARMREAAALCWLRRPAEAVAPAQEAVRLSRASPDPNAAINACNIAATVAKYNGDIADAEADYQAALALARQHGLRFQEHTNLFNLSVIATDRGDLRATTRLLYQTLEICREMRDEDCATLAAVPLGGALLYTGDLAEGERLLVDAAARHRAGGRRQREAEAIAFLAELAAKRGDHLLAARRDEEWGAMVGELGIEADADYAAVSALWHRFEAGEDLALDGEIATLAEKGQATANVALEGLARAVRAAGALATGRFELARVESRRASELLAFPGSPYLNYFVWQVRAEVLLATGDLAAAAPLLAAMLDRSRRDGVFSEELEIRLLNARLGAAQGGQSASGAAASALADLALEARTKGYLRTAARVEAARRRLLVEPSGQSGSAATAGSELG